MPFSGLNRLYLWDLALPSVHCGSICQAAVSFHLASIGSVVLLAHEVYNYLRVPSLFSEFLVLQSKSLSKFQVKTEESKGKKALLWARVSQPQSC